MAVAVSVAAATHDEGEGPKLRGMLVVVVVVVAWLPPVLLTTMRALMQTLDKLSIVKGAHSRYHNDTTKIPLNKDTLEQRYP